MADAPSNPPRYFCPECITCVEPSALDCPECGRMRPPDHWPPLAEGPYPYIGEQIDERYFIDRFIDSGASGHVYRARGARYGQQFAIKIVDFHRFDDQMRPRLVDRFFREVDTVAKLKSPHVIDVYEALKLGEGVFGLVMNYVDGQTLDAILEDQNRLPVDDAVSLTRQIANGLHEAHSHGIVHRDVKPDNIIVEKLPASGLFARILDFGVALAEGNDEELGFQGTPLYTSPEQCTEERPVDTRSDIYGLGCLFFHLLTGRPPFPYTNALRVMDAHVDAPRPHLSDVANLEFPDQLEHLVGHLLARDPDQRPETLDEVHRALATFEKGKPLSALGTRPEYRSRDSEKTFERPGETTPPSDRFVSLGERTSSELAADSTIPDDSEIADWSFDDSLTLEAVDKLDDSPLPDHTTTVTATAFDPRGLACIIAEATPALHLVGLGDELFETSFEFDQMISAVDADLHHGIFVVADVSGRVIEFEPGSGRPLSRHRLESSPMALETLASSGRLIVGTERGEVRSLDLRTESRHDITRFHQTVSALHQTDAGSLMVGLWDGSVALIDEQRRQWHLPVAPDAIADVGTFDQNCYFAVDARGTLHLGDRRSGELESSFEIGPQTRTTRRMADGRLLVLSLSNGGLQTWRVVVDS